MRIAFLNPIGQIGGAERSLLDVISSLREARPDWSLNLVAGEDGPLVAAAKELGVAVGVSDLPEELARLGDAGAGGPAGHGISKSVLMWRLGRAGISGAQYLSGLRKLLAGLKPDVIHTNGFKMHVLGAWAKPPGSALVWHIHDYVSLRTVMARLLRMHAAKCSAAIANSAGVAEDVQKICGPALRVRKVWNAVDLIEFSPQGSRIDLDAVCGLPPAGEVVRFGLAGTLARWKGQDVFLRALAMLPEEIPFRGYIVGGPLYRTDGSQWQLEELKRMADQLGLTGRIGFTGFLSRPAEAMRALDIVVHASTRPEPFGLVIVEAMACGRAVIVSRAGGAAEFTKDGIDVLAHAPGDAAGLADRMLRLARSRELRERLGQAGHAAAERDFDRRRLGPELAPLYESAVALRQADAA